MAYCHKELQQPHKRLIGLQTDVHAAFLGAKPNPMVRVPLEHITDTEESLIEVLRQIGYAGSVDRGITHGETEPSPPSMQG